jgi:hypothetical protein
MPNLPLPMSRGFQSLGEAIPGQAIPSRQGRSLSAPGMTGAQIDALTHGVQYQGVSVIDPVAAP